MAPKAYEFIGCGDIHGPKAYEFMGFGDIAAGTKFRFKSFQKSRNALLKVLGGP